MRRDDPPHYHAEECAGGAFIVSETQGVLEYRGIASWWTRDQKQIGKPFPNFSAAQRVVNELREADAEFFGKRKTQ